MHAGLLGRTSSEGIAQVQKHAMKRESEVAPAGSLRHRIVTGVTFITARMRMGERASTFSSECEGPKAGCY